MHTETETRQRAALKIISAPENYKVCESCESIVTARVVSCPSCSGYRFDSDADRVRAQAQELAQRERQSVVEEDFL